MKQTGTEAASGIQDYNPGNGGQVECFLTSFPCSKCGNEAKPSKSDFLRVHQCLDAECKMQMLEELLPRTTLLDSPLLLWAEVDLCAIAHNVRELRRIADPKARLMVVVKANAYGHGMIEVARVALQSGADVLGVARLEEGVRLRKEGFEAPVLVFGYTCPAIAKRLIEFDLTQTVCSYRAAKALSVAVSSYGKKVRVHLEVDTGMGSLGLLPDCLRPPGHNRDITKSAVREVESIARLGNLELEGIFTHFATANHVDRSFARNQFEIFIDFLDRLRLAGLKATINHAANSAAIINMPETHLDMVRAGISVYGLYPSNKMDRGSILLKPAMELKTRVIHLKRVPAGFKVGYGITYETKSSTTIATVPVGYADGFNRLLSSRGHMLVCGHRSPVIGRVCMDLAMLDVGKIPGVDIGDEVVIFGRQGDSSITVDEIASTLKTINYEIVSTITDRVPRLYLR